MNTVQNHGIEDERHRQLFVSQIFFGEVARKVGSTTVGYIIKWIGARIILQKEIIISHLITELAYVTPTVTRVFGYICGCELKVVLIEQNQDGLFSWTHDIAISGGSSQPLKCVRYLINYSDTRISRYSEISITTKWVAYAGYINDCFRVLRASENDRAGAATPTRKWSYPTTMLAHERGDENPSPPTALVVSYEDPETGQFILSGSSSLHAEIRAHATIDLKESR